MAKAGVRLGRRLQLCRRMYSCTAMSQVARHATLYAVYVASRSHIPTIMRAYQQIAGTPRLRLWATLVSELSSRLSFLSQLLISVNSEC